MRFTLAIVATLLLSASAHAAASPPNLAIQWNSATLQGIRDAKLGAPVVARALAIVHTCMYDAWAAYDERAVGTQLHGALRRPVSERTPANKEQAISYAAYRALADVLPADTNSVYIPLMKHWDTTRTTNPPTSRPRQASATWPAERSWNSGIMTSPISWAN